jgi:hypothetical protein
MLTNERLGLVDNRATLAARIEAGALPRGTRIPGPYGKVLVGDALGIAELIELRVQKREGSAAEIIGECKRASAGTSATGAFPDSSGSSRPPFTGTGSLAVSSMPERLGSFKSRATMERHICQSPLQLRSADRVARSMRSANTSSAWSNA